MREPRRSSQRRGTPGNQLLSDVRPALPEIARAGRTEGPSLALLGIDPWKTGLIKLGNEALACRIVMAVGAA